MSDTSADPDPLRDIGSRLHHQRMEELTLGARVEAMKAAVHLAGTRVNRAFTVAEVIGDAALIADFITTGQWAKGDATEEKIA